MNQPLPTPPSLDHLFRSARPPGRAHWTPARQCAFLTQLLESGSVAQAARAVGLSRSSIYRLRERLDGTAFDRSWDQALRLHAERMADPLSLETTAPAMAPARA